MLRPRQSSAPSVSQSASQSSRPAAVDHTRASAASAASSRHLAALSVWCEWGFQIWYDIIKILIMPNKYFASTTSHISRLIWILDETLYIAGITNGMKRVSKKYTNPHIDHHRPIFTSGQPAASVATTLPPRYGSSAEESSPKPSETDEKPKKNEKKRKTTRKKGTDDDHVPLGPGTRDDDDDEGSDDLVGLDNLLQLGEDGGPPKKPASKSSTGGSKKRPSTSKRSKKKDHFWMSRVT